jgi:hypothetical protein
MSEEKSHTQPTSACARGARVRDNSQVELSTLPTPSDTDSVKYKFEMNQIDGSEPYVKF